MNLTRLAFLKTWLAMLAILVGIALVHGWIYWCDPGPLPPPYLYVRHHCSMAWDCYQVDSPTMKADIGSHDCDGHSYDEDYLVDFEFTGKRLSPDIDGETYCETVYSFLAVDRDKPFNLYPVDDAASRQETATCPECNPNYRGVPKP